VDKLNSSDVVVASCGKKNDGGYWSISKLFAKRCWWSWTAVNQGMLAMEKNVGEKRQQNTMGDDPSVSYGWDPGDN